MTVSAPDLHIKVPQFSLIMFCFQTSRTNHSPSVRFDSLSLFVTLIFTQTRKPWISFISIVIYNVNAVFWRVTFTFFFYHNYLLRNIFYSFVFIPFTAVTFVTFPTLIIIGFLACWPLMETMRSNLKDPIFHFCMMKIN